MRGRIVIALLGLGSAALATEPVDGDSRASRHLEAQRALAQARQDALLDRTETITRRAMNWVCTGCMNPDLPLQERSRPIDAEALVAGRFRPAVRGAATPAWKTLLLARLIRN